MKQFDQSDLEERHVITPDGIGTLKNYIVDETGAMTDWLVKFDGVKQRIYKAEQLQEVEE